MGRTPYEEALAAQHQAREGALAGDGGVIFGVEHDAVFTLGRRARAAEVLDAGAIPVVETDRGGRVTYHGPGQAVLYPILRLDDHGLGVRAFVRALEQAALDVLADHGVVGDRDLDNPGVWVDDRKIAAVGVHVRRGVTTHGLAFNVDLDLGVYQRFIPCGLPFRGVTRLADLVASPPAVEAVAAALAHHLARTLATR